MTKQLMISIRPEHAINILNGKKTLELRKWIPKDYVGWVYVYVTKGIGKTKYHHLYNLTKYNNGKTLFSITHHNKHSLVPDDFLNSKVVFRFWFDDYIKLKFGRWVNHKVGDWNYRGYMDEHLETFKKACLTEEEVNDYGDGKPLYVWHIKKLEVFDEPKELSEFESRRHRSIIRAPQKMQWVYAKEKENEKRE